MARYASALNLLTHFMADFRRVEIIVELPTEMATALTQKASPGDLLKRQLWSL